MWITSPSLTSFFRPSASTSFLLTNTLTRSSNSFPVSSKRDRFSAGTRLTRFLRHSPTVLPSTSNKNLSLASRDRRSGRNTLILIFNPTNIWVISVAALHTDITILTSLCLCLRSCLLKLHHDQFINFSIQAPFRVCLKRNGPGSFYKWFRPISFIPSGGPWSVDSSFNSLLFFRYYFSSDDCLSFLRFSINSKYSLYIFRTAYS